MRIQRINFKRQCKMHLVCGDDYLRTTLQLIYFSNGFAYASDLHILVKNKLSEITELIPEDQLLILNGKMLHKSSFEKILTYDRIKITENGIECTNRFSTDIVEFKYNVDKLNYPDAESLFELAKKKSGSIDKISFNPTFIYKLQKAMFNDDKMVFNFSGNASDPILVKSQDIFIESEGIIMPIAIK